VAVCVRQERSTVAGEVFGNAEHDDVRRQVARILSLDVDAGDYGAVGRRDPIAGSLQSRYPGLRPVLFWSPYEAAAWTVIGRRIRMTQAARIKQRMAEELGESVNVHGETLRAFPGPHRVLDIPGFPGLSGRKVEWLHSVAEAALDGRLDAARLRADGEAALPGLKSLPGIGDFSAELILARGAGDPDHWPKHERRLHRAMAAAYGLGDFPPVETLAAIADKWRPYRSWVSLLFRASAEEARPL
jgi:DNA-3-methyladenine glycosylase II